jgi:hypothetical protein
MEVGCAVANCESVLPIPQFIKITAGAHDDFVAGSPYGLDHPMGNSTDTYKSPTHYIAEGTKNQRIVSTVQIV